MDNDKNLMEGIDAKLEEHGFGSEGLEEGMSIVGHTMDDKSIMQAARVAMTAASRSMKLPVADKHVIRDAFYKALRGIYQEDVEVDSEPFEEGVFSFTPSRQQQVQAARDGTNGAAGKVSQALFVGVEDEYVPLSTKMYGIVKRHMENAVQEGVKMMKGHKKSSRARR
ncbi:MAG: hypothetical protein JRG69_07800 [Deltaproteobacteria bacterium]|nr:hypothetical protein [Deltaproteobacteria bacterium]